MGKLPQEHKLQVNLFLYRYSNLLGKKEMVFQEARQEGQILDQLKYFHFTRKRNWIFAFKT